MIIDLSDWNEYIADDVPPGHPPLDVELEFMQIISTNLIYKSDKEHGLTLYKSLKVPRLRMFWRLKQ